MTSRDKQTDIGSRFAERISDVKYAQGTEIERTSKKYARSLVPSDEPLEILDVGCGTGLNAKEIASNGHIVTGVDVSSVAIEKFRQAGFDGKQCDISYGIPFHDHSFDLVFASDVIEHLVDTEAFLKETYRVLRPSGRLILSTINSSFWVFRLFCLLGRTVSEVQHPGHIRFFSKAGLSEQVAEAGFESIVVSGRHMYFIVSGKAGELLEGILHTLGFQREIRFRTQSPFWHLSRFSKKASPLWAEALILTARKASN